MSKDSVIVMRADEATKAEWVRLAELAGLSLTEWITLRCNSHTLVSDPVPVVPKPQKPLPSLPPVAGLCANCQRKAGRPLRSCPQCWKD